MANASKHRSRRLSARSPKASRPKRSAATDREVQFTHEDRVMFPEVGATKGDVLRFYQQIAPRLLPHLKDRPVTLERVPGGLVEGAPRFWQKNTPEHYPKWIRRVNLPSERGEDVNYVLVNDEPTLLYLVNQGAVCFHTFLSRVQDLDRPDYVLFDFDPSGAPFAQVVTVAKKVRQVLEAQKADAYVKTSGKSGLHVLTSWIEKGGYDEARAWAMSVAEEVISATGEIATTERLKSQRHGRVYLDVIQNARGHHAVPPYVLRVTPEATVSTPLEWDELTAKLNPKRFDLFTIFNRLKKLKKDPMAPLVERWERKS